MSPDLPDQTILTARAPARDGVKSLRVRIASALVLAGLALGANYLSSVVFAGLVGALAVLMSWEWSRITRGTDRDLIFYVQAGAVVAAGLLTLLGHAGLGLIVIAAAALLVAPLAFGLGVAPAMLGVVYVGLPALALIQLRGDAPWGVTAILFLFAVAWTTDTASFVAGRSIGGPKLWRSISPEKTWAGLWGGVIASGVMGAAFAGFLPDMPMAWLTACGLGLGVVAQAGDLGESALKRGLGVKDTSEFIPGHGGVMDRLDSLVTVAVAAVLLGLIVNPQSPAQGLLFGG